MKTITSRKYSVKPNLEQRRAFCIYQLIRLTGATTKDLNKLSTNELEALERGFYHDKYNSHGKPEYIPMINP
jgi:hypothetical protein